MRMQTSEQPRAIRGTTKRAARPKLTSAFRDHIKALPAGTETTTAEHAAWVTSNLKRLGAPEQTQHTAEASCRCASQRLIVEGWLERVGARNVYRRTGKRRSA